MKLYAPAYYPRFACIADRCRHSCCIGWEIDVDEDTLQRYDALEGGYGEKISASIEGREDCPHFCLGEGERCPHLNECGLCRIILSLGEDYLCDICREHPRFYHETVHGREVGLGMACEEACRLILESEIEPQLILLGEDGEEEADTSRFDTLPARAQLYALLREPLLPYATRLELMAATYELSPADYPDAHWRALFSNLEYMNKANRVRYATCFSTAPDTPAWAEPYLARALSYFIFRHCTPAEDAQQFAASLGLCLILERLLASLSRDLPSGDLAALQEHARTLSEELEYSEDNTDAIRSFFF